MSQWLTDFYMCVHVWSGAKLFNYVDVYHGGTDELIAVTWSNDKDYIDRIFEMEEGMSEKVSAKGGKA